MPEARRELTRSDKAVVHLIRRIVDDPDTAYRLGYGTRSWELLVAAYADLYRMTYSAVNDRLLESAAKGKTLHSENERLRSWLCMIEGGDTPCRDEAQLRQWAYEAVTLGNKPPEGL